MLDVMWTSFMTNHIKGSLIEKKPEWMQYSACLVISCAFKGTSREHLNQELRLESLKYR